MRMRRFCRSLVSVALLIGEVFAQTPPLPAITATPAQPAPFEKQLRKAVTFIQDTCSEGNHERIVSGTGFFVSVPEKRLGPQASFVYLVTNRHVAMAWDAQSHPLTVNSAAIRLNQNDGKSTWVKHAGNLRWFLPIDDSTDLAVTSVQLNHDLYDYETVPDSILATDDVVTSKAISEGMKILFSGLFYSFPGETRMQPIVRAGIIAMMPDEDLVTTMNKKGKVYLGDVHAFHGNSGSPVFVDVNGTRGGMTMAGQDFRMLGVISGFYGEDDKFNLTVQTNVSGNAGSNSSIAVIVPAMLVKDLLNDPRVVAEREAAVTKWQTEHK
jgi:hypothetical protein